jgi:hypothetical protein
MFVKEHKILTQSFFWLNSKNKDTLKQSFAVIVKCLHDENSSSALLRMAAELQNIDQTVTVIK